MKKINYAISAVLLFLSQALNSDAQFAGLFSSSFSPSILGPQTSVGPASILFSGGTISAGGPISVTATYANQQYPGPLVTGQGDAGLMFGVGSNGVAKTLIKQNVGVPLNNVGAPVNSYYQPTNSTAASLNVATSYGFNMFTSAEALQGMATDGRYYMGDVTFTFSRDINLNAPPLPIPANSTATWALSLVMHVTGLGGFYAVPTGGQALPFETELELVGTNVQLQKLQGTTHLALGTSPFNIYNNFTASEYTTGGSTPVNGNNAGTGSLKITPTTPGGLIRSLTFRVYLKGLIAGQSWTSPPGFSDPTYSGDRFNVTFTLLEILQSTLPVSGIRLDAALNGNDVTLNWNTESELNSYEFEVERSTDGVNFSKIGTKNASGNSFSRINYNFADPNMSARIYYYRLKLVDLDGKITYSNIALVRKPGIIRTVKVFPNPVSEQMNLEFSNATGNYSVVLFNQAGQQLINKQVNIISTVQYVNLSRGNLPPGSYLLNIKNLETNERFSQNVIFNK